MFATAAELQSRLQAHQPRLVNSTELRPAGVLVPLVCRGDSLEVVLIRRPGDLPTHPGQIAFPGGGYQSEDDSLADTALREAREEIGLDSGAVRILGMLDEVWTPSGYRMRPYVGWIDQDPQLCGCPREVAEILRIPLERLVVPGVFREETWERQQAWYRIAFFDLEEATVWGATGRILARLLQIGFAWDAVSDRPWESGPVRVG